MFCSLLLDNESTQIAGNQIRASEWGLARKVIVSPRNHLAIICNFLGVERALETSFFSGVINMDINFIDGKDFCCFFFGRRSKDIERDIFCLFKIKYYLYLYAAYRRVIFYPSSWLMTRESQQLPWLMCFVTQTFFISEIFH